MPWQRQSCCASPPTTRASRWSSWSWLCERPVLVHSQCAVTRDFARRANGGLYFRNYFEFEGCVQYILTHPEQARTMGQNGGAFVRENFDWDVIVEKYRAFFAKLTEE